MDKDTIKYARKILHDFEFCFDGAIRPGALEEKYNFVQAIAESLKEILDDEKCCNCDCAICSLGDHG